jgi:S1-C subfamily serine protease
MAHGRVIRGSLGLDPADLSDEQATALGLISGGGVAVASVYPDSPAFDAGLRRGDMITSLGGEQIKTAQELVSRVAALAPGTYVQVEGRRGLRAFKLRVTVIERPQSTQQAG